MYLSKTAAINHNLENTGCVYNHTLLLWKMGYVSKAINGWALYRKLPITSHEQCQQMIDKLKKRYCIHLTILCSYFPTYSHYKDHKQEHLEEITVLMDLTVMSHTLKRSVVNS